MTSSRTLPTIERKGIESTADDERSGIPRHHFWLWAAANLNPFVISSGLLVLTLGLSWKNALIAIVVGTAIGYPLVGFVALAGLRGGAPTMTLSRATFGYSGNKLPTLVAYLACIGWEAIALFLAATATRTLASRVIPEASDTTLLVLGLVLPGAATIVIAVYGYHLVIRAQKWITLAITIAIIGYCCLVIPKVGLPHHMPSDGGRPLLAGVTFVIAAGGLAWVMTGADYSRYLPARADPRGVVGWTTLGGAIAPIVLMFFGVFAGVARPDLASRAAVDPIGALVLPLPTWFFVPFLLTTILGLIGSGVVNLYSSGLNLLTLGIKVSRPAAIAVDSTLIVLASSYLIFLSPGFFASFESFLTVLGIPLAAWCAIFLVDFYRRHRTGYQLTALYPATGNRAGNNPAALAAMLLATVIGIVMDASGHLASAIGAVPTEQAWFEAFASMKPGLPAAFIVGGLLYDLFLPRQTRRLLSPAGNALDR
ncbi:purine-cytosine permease family protein [Nocardia sp. NPDC051321]|uniref:purine-cytosine permease family protein n=1 Tax=Nocardia sp. NPDC051321 TaxID=3364323 RepID=UPI0037A672A8